MLLMLPKKIIGKKARRGLLGRVVPFFSSKKEQEEEQEEDPCYQRQQLPAADGSDDAYADDNAKGNISFGSDVEANIRARVTRLQQRISACRQLRCDIADRADRMIRVARAHAHAHACAHVQCAKENLDLHATSAAGGEEEDGTRHR